MKNILITGSNGFIGQNLCAHLEFIDSLKIIRCDKDNFLKVMKNYINDIDFIFHLAGTNRSNNENDYLENNVHNTEFLTSCLQNANNKAPIIFTSSIQVINPSIYSQTKKKAEDILIKHSKKNQSKVSIFRLPNVFGKWSKPNYNSFISTVINNVINNKETDIWDGDKNIELLYIDDLIELLKKSIFDPNNLPTYLEDFFVEKDCPNNIHKKILTFNEERESQYFNLNFNALDKKLYSTYLSFLDIKKCIFPIKSNIDKRGNFIEFIRSPSIGQVSAFYSNINISRGNHFHHSKVERFLILSGKAKFNFKHLLTGDKFEKIVSYDKPCIVETFPGWIHSIHNEDNNLLSGVIWANEIFDKTKPDTYLEGEI